MKKRNCDSEPKDDEIYQIYDDLFKKMSIQANISNEKYV